MLVAQAREPNTPHVTAAHLMQVAVAIRLLLVVAPVRIGTLVKTLVGTHMTGSQPGLGGDVTLHYPKGLVKNNVDLNFVVDPDSVALVKEYLSEFRPRLKYGEPQALFPGIKEGNKGEGTLANQITQTIRDYVGLKFNVHLFRHLTAFLYLCKHPADYSAVQHALGHKQLKTTMTFYCWMEKDKIVQNYQKTILGVVDGDE